MNNLGVAILNTDRPHCLKRILSSIENHTKKFPEIFIVDDSTNEPDIKFLPSWVHYIHTGERIGIAKNTNFALQMISEFPYKIIFNNDVEILKNGWDELYIDGMKKTNIHCFSFRQLGLWGAVKFGERGKRPDRRWVYSGVNIATIKEMPQGALIAFDQKAFETVGYYDTEFKKYGASHHDWCNRISLSGIQPMGFHDLGNSNEYFKVHDEVCTTSYKDRKIYYQKNMERYRNICKNKNRTYIDYS